MQISMATWTTSPGLTTNLPYWTTRVSARWDDIVFAPRRARKVSYPGWPFELDGPCFAEVYDEQRADHRLYVALLIASSLRLCVATRSNEITSAFEEISYHWLSRSLTQFWKVRPFGAHATLPDAYVGNLREKLELLAADINAKLQRDADEYEPENTGDGGSISSPGRKSVINVATFT